jgi:hypothetical protein
MRGRTYHPNNPQQKRGETAPALKQDPRRAYRSDFFVAFVPFVFFVVDSKRQDAR